MSSAERNKLRWRCRRGMKELDVMLARYLTRGYPQADEAERLAFTRLLEASDPELAAWLIYRHPCPDSQLALAVAAVCACEG
ncbi:FAD assembly factor SdhE [Methylohalobius crimeensis]|uniref:FAD assembly factor SdhE n=1 Tax=Methylohalobius crimeensis TaxID=244365 RepID=UPI0003B3050E|nr:succinate dehydrogenase assembly factor 2 [Methylohalobius crimeensis]